MDFIALGFLKDHGIDSDMDAMKYSELPSTIETCPKHPEWRSFYACPKCSEERSYEKVSKLYENSHKALQVCLDALQLIASDVTGRNGNTPERVLAREALTKVDDINAGRI